MGNNKSKNWNIFEKTALGFVIAFLLINALIHKDSIPALISAICGITYTFLAGKGLPTCYLFGVCGSSFYSLISFQNALWGNLILYACYYIPMQIIGYFRWNKNLKENKKEIIKITLPKKEMTILILILMIISSAVYCLLVIHNDKNPLLDSITTVFSIGGMYLTVRRAIEQWIFWMGVNLLSLIMWINIASTSEIKVYSTIVMWTVYLFLAIYFYIEWRKELNR